MLAEGDHCVLREKAHVHAAVSRVSALEPSHGSPIILKWETYSEDRSARQNRLMWKWFGEVAKQGGEYTADEIHRIAKLRYGVPILIESNQPFSEWWDRVHKMFPTYEEQIDKLMLYTPVTSIMNTKQMSRFLSDFEREAGRKYQLTSPSLYGLEKDFQ